MGFSSQAGSVAFRTQSTPGVFPADFETDAIAMRLRTGALAANRELLVTDPEIGGGRDVADASLGPVSYAGDYEFYVRLQGIMTLLKAGLGTHVSGPGGVNEVETITATGTWSGGTYTITYDGQTTAPIPYNANAGAIQSALTALPNVGPYDVLVTGGPLHEEPVVVSFTGALSGALIGAPLTVDTALVTGTSPNANVTRTVQGQTSTGAYSNLFVPSDAPQLPFLGIEENVGGGFDVFRYTDAVVNTLHFESDANGFFMGTAGMIARLQEAMPSPVDVSDKFDNLDTIVGTNISVSFGAQNLAGKSVSVDFTNNFETDDFRLGSFFIGDLTPKRRELTVGLTIREQDHDMWRQATYGNSAATMPGGVVQKENVTITASTYSVIPGASPALAYSMSIIIPYCVLRPYALNVSGDDIIDSDIEFQALRPYPSIPLFMVRVVNHTNVVA